MTLEADLNVLALFNCPQRNCTLLQTRDEHAQNLEQSLPRERRVHEHGCKCCR